MSRVWMSMKRGSGTGVIKHAAAWCTAHQEQLLAGLLTLAVLGGMLFLLIINPALRSRRAAEQCRAAMHEIQLGVERFAVDTEGSYPVSIADVIRKGYIAELPLNPYTGRRMRELHRYDAFSQGDFYYVAYSPPGSSDVDQYAITACINPNAPLHLDPFQGE